MANRTVTVKELVAAEKINAGFESKYWSGYWYGFWSGVASAIVAAGVIGVIAWSF